MIELLAGIILIYTSDYNRVSFTNMHRFYIPTRSNQIIQGRITSKNKITIIRPTLPKHGRYEIKQFDRRNN